MNLKTVGKGIWKDWDEGKQREKCCNYITISKLLKIEK